VPAGRGIANIANGTARNNPTAESLVAAARPAAAPNVMARRVVMPSRAIAQYAASPMADSPSMGTSTLPVRA